MKSDKKLNVIFVGDFYNQWVKACAESDKCSEQEVIENYDSEGDLKKMADRISGKEGCINIFENRYGGVDDYFEEVDDNFVIFPELFEVKEG